MLTNSSMEQYTNLNQPPLSPPAIVFPIVWTILFILMGISAYFVSVSEDEGKEKALWIYGIQLVFNFFWTIFFFKMQWRLFAFFWLIALILLIIWMIRCFYRIKPAAAYLQIPYLLWSLFAAYLNLSIYLLNG